MTLRAIATRTAIGTLSAVVLAGVACGVASADPGAGRPDAAAARPAPTYTAPRAAAQSPRPQQAQGSPAESGDGDLSHWYLTNNTPYTWTLSHGRDTADMIWNGSSWLNRNWARETPPKETLQPHERLRMDRALTALPGQNGESQFVLYTFADVKGQLHEVQANGNQNNDLSSTSFDCTSLTSCSPSTAYFHMTLSEFNFGIGGDASRTIGVAAVLNSPAQVSIDAAKDPAKATSAMNGWDEGINKSFSNLSTPVWTQSRPEQGSAKVINASSAPVKMVATNGSTNSESTSLSLEVSWKSTLNIFGFANASVGASIVGGHSWAYSTSVEDGNDMTIDPQQMGWMTKTSQVQSVTGDFNFTDSTGMTYHIRNVTISMPGIPKPNQNIPTPGTAFTPTWAPAPPLPPING